MGIMSRRVLPICADFACFACPNLRARSRQPTKRYKGLLFSIYPKKQDAAVNERAIGKLADYAEQNPNRIPTIVNKLEQRGIKDLRARQLGSLKATMRAYGKLLSTCKEHMPIFALSALSMITALLEDRDREMHLMACQTFTDFALNQVDTMYAYQMDKLLPQLVAVTRETGEERQGPLLKAAGLHALAALIWYAVEYSHIPPDFDDLVATVLDNYEVLGEEGREGGESGRPHHHQGLKHEARTAVRRMREAAEKLRKAGKPSFTPRDIGHISKADVEHPEVWAHICVQGLARLTCQDATSAKRVLGPLLRYLDNGKHWGPLPRCLALDVLLELQAAMDSTGNSHVLLASLVRHLEHQGQVAVQIAMVRIMTELARHSPPCAPQGAVAVLSDLSRVLRRSLEHVRKAEAGAAGPQRELRSAIEECLPHLARLVGHGAPLLDMLALALESLSGDPLTAETSMEALALVAHAVATLLETSASSPQAFPDGLLFQLLQAMAHPDPATRIGAHRLLAILLPPLARPWEGPQELASPGREGGREKEGPIRTRSGALKEVKETGGEAAEEPARVGGKGAGGHASHRLRGLQSFKMGLERNFSRRAKSHPGSTPAANKELEEKLVRLSGAQAGLLLSSLYHQALLPDSPPAGYAALAHTFSLAILLSPSKTSRQSVVVQAVQLALSLRSMALESEGPLPPARRRSLLSLATAMLLAAGRAYGFPHLAPTLRALLAGPVRDPWLEVREDGAVVETPAGGLEEYAAAADNRAAAEVLAGVELTANETPAGVVQLILAEAPGLEVLEGADVASRMLRAFAPEDSDILRPRLFAPPELPSEPAFAEGSQSAFEIEDLASDGLADEDLIWSSSATDLAGTGAANEDRAAAPSVEQLLESLAAETPEEEPAQMGGPQGEAQGAWARALRVLEEEDSVLVSDGTASSEEGLEERARTSEGFVAPQLKELWEDFRLPPSSSYDNFLRAAGC